MWRRDDGFSMHIEDLRAETATVHELEPTTGAANLNAIDPADFDRMV